MSSENIIAIIPARGGSKGVPRKNIKPLSGRPLIAYTIDAALQCKAISRCVVSTEDLEIARVSAQLGAEVIQRPAALADDTTRTAPVVEHVLDVLTKKGQRPSYIVLLQPTSPLRNAGHVDRCISQFLTSQCKCAISVCPVEHHPYKCFEVSDGKLRAFAGTASLDSPREQLPPIYRQTGAIYILGVDDFLGARTFFVEPAMPFLMSPEESIDIDSVLDFQMAEILLQQVRESAATF